ncbi:MAG: class II aldolase/adducin family protein [Rhodospirillales bacterium]|nr:class II aldolase/adducin family protein [Rhodospirillales bacterium]
MSTIRRQLAALYKDVAARGLNEGSSGNVSARAGRGMLITPTGCTAATVTPKSLVTMGLDGTFKGRTRPSSEWEMHAAIYRAAPEAMVIVHTHSDHATALACLNQPLPAFHYAVLAFGGAEVRVAPYVTFGTAALAEAATEAIAGRTACLLANHGMICHGRNVAGALAAALLLETLARQYLIARAAGTPRLLSEDEMAQARLRFRSYGQQPERDRKNDEQD